MTRSHDSYFTVCSSISLIPVLNRSARSITLVKDAAWRAERGAHAHHLRCKAFIYPELEERKAFWRPRLVTRHAPVNQAGVDLRSPSFDVFV